MAGLAAVMATHAALAAQQSDLRIVKNLPYFSYVRFSAALVAGAYTIPRGAELKAFAYAIGDDMGPAGRTGVFATRADTNIQTKSQPLDGETVEIHGLTCQVSSGGGADPGFAQFSMRDLSVRLSLNGGDRTFQFGNAEMIPGGTGLFSSDAASAGASGAVPGTLNSGWPDVSNYFPLEGGITWNPAGGTDSSLIIVINPERAIVFPAGAVAPPASIFFDLRLQFVGISHSKTSGNL